MAARSDAPSTNGVATMPSGRNASTSASAARVSSSSSATCRCGWLRTVRASMAWRRAPRGSSPLTWISQPAPTRMATRSLLSPAPSSGPGTSRPVGGRCATRITAGTASGPWLAMRARSSCGSRQSSGAPKRRAMARRSVWLHATSPFSRRYDCERSTSMMRAISEAWLCSLTPYAIRKRRTPTLTAGSAGPSISSVVRACDVSVISSPS